MLPLAAYGAIFGVCSVILLIVSLIFYRTNNPGKKYLFLCSLSGVVVNITYLLSLFTKVYFISSVFSSIYFCCIDVMLMLYLRYIVYFTGGESIRIYNFAKPFIIFYGIIDFIVILINPFCEITLHYREMSIYPGHFEYADPYPVLYWMHLIYSYILVLMVFYLLFKKMFTSPKVYRSKYLIVIYGLLGIVVINALFLFVKNVDLLDFSIIFYSVQLLLCYLNDNYFTERKLLSKTRSLIFNEFITPTIIFDYEDQYAAANDVFKHMYNDDERLKRLNADSLITEIGADLLLSNRNENISFSCFPDKNDKTASYHCDYRILRDAKSAEIGKLFAFTKVQSNIDYLTGFDTKLNYERNHTEKEKTLSSPVSVSVYNINKLNKVNKLYGIDIGDKAVKLLSDYLRTYCPKDTYFARFNDANLVAVCQNTTESDLRKINEVIEKNIEEDTSLGFKISVQAAVSASEGDISLAAKSAEEALAQLKLMDFNSERSSLLNSLIQIQQENDSDTTAHVRRTHLLGRRLGMRLGLTDSELGKLSLLCILHDIGKLGIPFEVLNKPGRLTAREFALMRSHVYKGYRIAKSSAPIENLADLILHHHESWNGSGYPDGLKGEEIPLLSRIISVVDAYDAMTNDRVYRKALSKSKARREINRMAGIQFDPIIAKEFLKMLEEIDPLTEPVYDFEKENTIEYKAVEEFSNTEAAKRLSPVMFSKYFLDSDFKILMIDDNFTAMTGYTQEDVDNGLSQRDLIFPEDRNYYFGLIGEKPNPEAYIKHRILCKDGLAITVNCHGKMFFDPVSNIMTSEIVMIFADK